jgi:hypothetical protein
VAVRPLQTAARLRVAVLVLVVVHLGIRLVLHLVVVTVLVLCGLTPGLLQVVAVQTRLLPEVRRLAAVISGKRLAVAVALDIQMVARRLLGNVMTVAAVQAVTVAS